jgi:hypothetical protein
MVHQLAVFVHSSPQRMEEFETARRKLMFDDSRKLGHTDLAIMKIETGDADPVSQTPYHTSPAGRKIVDETLAELLAEDLSKNQILPGHHPQSCES